MQISRSMRLASTLCCDISAMSLSIISSIPKRAAEIEKLIARIRRHCGESEVQAAPRRHQVDASFVDSVANWSGTGDDIKLTASFMDDGGIMVKLSNDCLWMGYMASVTANERFSLSVTMSTGSSSRRHP